MKLQLARATLKRGDICHWRQPFGPHFAVILNLSWPPTDDVVYFAIMTSKTWKFPASVGGQIIRTGPLDYAFLDRDTIIDLRQVHTANLSVIAYQHEFGVKEILNPAHVSRTDAILRASITIEQDVLDRIVTP